MSTYQIYLDHDAIIEQINNILDNTGHIIAAAVKDLVYSNKDEIIDKVVDRATKEIVRKGLSRLLEMAGDTE